jgi:hypothetical protein
MNKKELFDKHQKCMTKMTEEKCKKNKTCTYLKDGYKPLLGNNINEMCLQRGHTVEDSYRNYNGIIPSLFEPNKAWNVYVKDLNDIHSSLKKEYNLIKEIIPWEVEIDNNDIVYAFSDIHADIHSLIINLRDCARVIKKKDGFNFKQNCNDADMEKLLNIDIANNDNGYIDDLNYEWNNDGKNVHIIICGDIIDGRREDRGVYDNDISDNRYLLPDNKPRPHEYKTLEIKILRFINALNRQIIPGYIKKIYKIIGNHERLNIIDIHKPINDADITEQIKNDRSKLRIKKFLNNDLIQKKEHLRKIQSDYINKHTLAQSNYYRGVKRLEVFRPNNPGFDILFEGTIYCLLKIKDYIFCHAGLLDANFNIIELKNCTKIHNFLNNPEERKLQSNWYGYFKYVLGKNTLDTNFVDTPYEFSSVLDNNRQNSISDKGFSDSTKDSLNNSLTCDRMQEELDELKEEINRIPKYGNYMKNIENLQLVVGHCVQSGKTYPVKTYNDLIEHNNIYEKYNNTTINPTPRTEDEQVPVDLNYRIGIEPKIPIKNNGINLLCNIPATTKFSIIRLDVGTSRGYDLYLDPVKLKQLNPFEKKRLFIDQRTPQVLCIEFINNIPNEYIIKSSQLNTRRHQIRPHYESIFRTIENDKDSEEANDGQCKHLPINLRYPTAYYKYLKYKRKYLSLINSI